MKILYAIQGTGNGHISRANEIIPVLERRVTVDILMSGNESSLKLNYPIKFKLKGLTFKFGKKGNIDIIGTLLNINFIRLIKEIRSLKIDEYDLVISDFEPVSAWACIIAKKYCIGLSNQYTLLNKEVKKPNNFNFLHKIFLKYYSPVHYGYGYHYRKIQNNTFFPLIKRKIRNAKIKNLYHYTIYLPSYSVDEIIKELNDIKKISFHVFSREILKESSNNNFHLKPINQNLFIKSISTCEGVICNAGFETTSEAIFLKKKLLVIPMKNQFEQKFNALCLKKLGFVTLKKLKKKDVKHWIKNKKNINIDFEQNTEEIVDRILLDYIKRLPKVPILQNSIN